MTRELQDSWTLYANGCANEITTITVIFNKLLLICLIFQKTFLIAGSIISVVEWLPDRGTIWSTLAKAAWNCVIATILFVSKSFIWFKPVSFLLFETFSLTHTVIPLKIFRKSLNPDLCTNSSKVVAYIFINDKENQEYQ